jgi:hypothetical protein
MRGAALVLAALLSASAQAEETDLIVTSGKLPIAEFYALVSCGASPGGPCANEPLRWSPERASDLDVGFVTPPRVPGVIPTATLGAAFDQAITEINAAGAALHLRRATKSEDPPIRIFVSSSRQGGTIRGTGVRDVDGEPLGAALVTVWSDDDGLISDAVIVLAADLPEEETLPVLLEELTQGMGLLTDIRNPFYEEISVFSEHSNTVRKLGPQDAAALRLHYPLS